MRASNPSLFRWCALLLAALVLSGCSVAQKKARALERADRFYAAEEFEKAKPEYLNVLRLDPKDARANERLGLIWQAQGSPLRAGAYLNAAREAAPGDFALQTRIAQILLAVGKVDAARHDALTILSRSPHNEDALLVLVECVRTAEDLLRAESELTAFGPDNHGTTYHLAAAALALRKGDRTAAKLSLQRARILEPQSPAVHSALAAFHQWQGDRAEAAKEFRIAAEAAPQRSAACVAYGEYLLKNGQEMEGLAYLTKLADQVPDYLPAWLALAQHALDTADYPRAQTLLQRVLAQDSENYVAHVLSGQVALARGELPQAIEKLGRLTTAFPGLAPAHHQLALARLRQNQPAEAAAALRGAIAAQPDHEASVLLLAELDLKAGRAEPVVEAMIGLLTRRPTLNRAQLLLTVALRSLGRYDAAAKVVREKLRLAPKNGPLHFALGAVQLEQRDAAGARASFERALQLSPDYFPAYLQLVDLDLREGKAGDALQRAEGLVHDFPASADARFLVGRVHAARGDWAQAEPALRKAIELDSNYTAAYGLLLYGLIRTNQLTRALGELEVLRAKTPDNLPVLLLSGVLYAQLGQPAKARAAYEAYLALKPDGNLALNNLALLLAEEPGQLDRALDLVRKARTLEPDSAAIADTLGWVHYRRKEYGPAVEALRQAVAGLPDNAEVQYHFALASLEHGDPAGARAAFLKAAAAPDDFPGKDQIAGHLARLPAAPRP